jgi:hypothetical protein
MTDAPLPDLDGLMLSQLIDLLVEPTEPAPISLLPQTAGWAVVGVLAVAPLAWLGWRRWTVWKAEGWRRAALAELDRTSPQDAAAQAALLRRAALARHPRAEVAGLTGEAWASFLARTGNLDPEEATALMRAAYRGAAHDGSALVRHWIVAQPKARL